MAKILIQTFVDGAVGTTKPMQAVFPLGSRGQVVQVANAIWPAGRFGLDVESWKSDVVNWKRQLCV